MRALRLLPLLFALLAPSAFAEGLYQIELILFRQPGDPLLAGKTVPEDWAAGAQKINAENQRTPALNDQAAKLAQADGYRVLLHQAWQQSLGESPSKMSLSAGKQQFGHSPVEGTVALTQARFVDVQTDFWINHFGAEGFVTGSERLQQAARVKAGELTFLDHGNLGVLIRVNPL